jgi:hypothetical protein
MKIKKKIGYWLYISVFSLVLVLVSFEFIYRFQWFDFYKPELNGLNARFELESSKPKVLIAGDSFTASLDSYAAILKDSLPEYSVINAAVPGTGIRQHALYLPRRIKRFKPDVFIYQFYVGNDLFDISHPSASSHISFPRRAYWWLADRVLSISFINFRAAGFRYRFYDDAGGAYQPKTKEIFSVDHYSKREKFNNQAEPELLENTLYLLNGRGGDWKVFEKKFKPMVENLNPGTKKIFVIIPHQAQLSALYLNRHTQLGAHFSHPIHLANPQDYPLYKNIYALCSQLGFEVVDPLVDFRLTAPQFPVYYENDPHLNPAGQGVLASGILKKIR